MKPRICLLCNETFIPKSSRQKYCKKDVIKVCPVCGDEFVTECSPDAKLVCSKAECKKKSGYIGSISKKKICKICGREFSPTSSTQEYCNLPIMRTCEVCGNEFEISCTAEKYKIKTCSLECQNKLASESRQENYAKSHVVKCILCGKKFHPRTNTQHVCEDDHFMNCIVCGKKFKINYISAIGNVDIRRTCSDECLSKWRSENNPFSDSEVREKIKQTNLEKYGYEYPSQNPKVMGRMLSTYQERTGYSHPSKNPDTWKGKKLYNSSLEEKLKTVLDNNRIKYEQQYVINKEELSHSFDFYLPDYNMLIDVDGEYYHGYLDDSNGAQVSEDRDSIRPYLVAEDQIYEVIVETEFNQGVDRILEELHKLNSNLYNYDEEMFKWCRSIDFPYPQYTDKRLKKDYQSLCKYHTDKYSSHVKLGFSSIRHFHPSIYSARVGKSKSIKEAWEDDNLLKKVIHNRMIYMNNVDPSKILSGFYISKVAPKISIFNPVLAKYLCEKYLNEFEEVVDPFSGYSGRMLGVTSAEKSYRGSDINPVTVAESNNVILFHGIDAKVSCKDILDNDFTLSGECLLTCPPYSSKEVYGTESNFYSCDEWIDIILEKCDCKKYVFVVDKTEKYLEFVTEDLNDKSHFNKVNERVIVIDRASI